MSPIVENRSFIWAPAHLRRERPIESARHLVIHTMESPELSQTAENVARWLASLKPGGVAASVHFCIDQDSIIQQARLSETTCGAAGGNRYGVHIELAGRASQNAAQWADAASQATLRNAAALCREILIPKCVIPVRRLTKLQFLSGERGFLGHADVTNYSGSGSHWDPGLGFPWNQFLGLCKP